MSSFIDVPGKDQLCVSSSILCSKVANCCIQSRLVTRENSESDQYVSTLLKTVSSVANLDTLAKSRVTEHSSISVSIRAGDRHSENSRRRWALKSEYLKNVDNGIGPWACTWWRSIRRIALLISIIELLVQYVHPRPSNMSASRPMRSQQPSTQRSPQTPRVLWAAPLI